MTFNNKLSTALIALVLISGTALTTPMNAAYATVDPASVVVTLDPGESTTVTKTVTVPDIPPTVDVLLSMDLTGSMGGELSNVKTQMANIITELQSIPGIDLQMGLVSYEDYPATYDSSPDCTYLASYGTLGTDEPFRVDQAITSDFTALQAAVSGMVLGFGNDGPESYARMVWELGQADSGIDLRDGSFRVAVMFLDNLPHDCNLNAGLTTPLPSFFAVTGIDPGRDGIIHNADDIDWQDDAIPAATGNNVKLIVFDSSSSTVPSSLTPFWQQWAEATDGIYEQIQPSGIPFGVTSLPDLIEAKVLEAAANPVTVTGSASGCDPLIVTLSPSEFTDVTPGSSVVFEETIMVPDGTPSGDISCTVTFTAGGADIGTQTIMVTVPPQSTPGKVTGGGAQIDKDRNFGFNIQSSDGITFKGQLQYNDKVEGIKLHSDSMTFLSVSPDGTSATFEGTGTSNGIPVTFMVHVEDNGEPGTSDFFSITISELGYQLFGTLQKGNIQIHK